MNKRRRFKAKRRRRLRMLALAWLHARMQRSVRMRAVAPQVSCRILVDDQLTPVILQLIDRLEDIRFRRVGGDLVFEPDPQKP